jgi:hypothetical protein
VYVHDFSASAAIAFKLRWDENFSILINILSVHAIHFWIEAKLELYLKIVAREKAFLTVCYQSKHVQKRNQTLLAACFQKTTGTVDLITLALSITVTICRLGNH